MIKEKILELIETEGVIDKKDKIKHYSIPEIKTMINRDIIRALKTIDINTFVTEALNNEVGSNVFDRVDLELDIPYKGYVDSPETCIVISLFYIDNLRLNYAITIPYSIVNYKDEFNVKMKMGNIEKEVIREILDFNEKVEEAREMKKSLKNKIIDLTTNKYLDSIKNIDAKSKRESIGLIDKIRDLNYDLKNTIRTLELMNGIQEGMNLLLDNMKENKNVSKH